MLPFNLCFHLTVKSMFQLFRAFCYLAGLLAATSLLSGASVAFTQAYAAPKNLSVLLISMIVIGSIVRMIHLFLKFYFEERFKND